MHNSAMIWCSAHELEHCLYNLFFHLIIYCYITILMAMKGHYKPIYMSVLVSAKITIV